MAPSPYQISKMMVMIILLVYLLSSSSWSVAGVELPYMTGDVKEISGKSFDYIVVGGGTAGCPLAATLSEKFSVLLIERGSSPFGNPLIEDRKFYGYSLLQTDEFSSAAQDFVSMDGVRNTRGRILGGSSAINGGFYSRASEDFVKKAGWNDGLVQDAYKWVESKIVFVPELTQWQSVVQFGFLEAGAVPYNGYTLEHLQGTKIGGTVFDLSGKRHTAADLLEAGNPRNIVVLLNATAKSLIFHDDRNDTWVSGVRFIKSDGSSDETYEAQLNNSRGEVILSAGTLGSPQILLLSGIGPEKHLTKHNIKVKANLKGVGKEMQDNPGIALLVDRYPQNREPEPPLVAAIAENFKFIIESGVLPINVSSTRIPIAIKMVFPESKGRLRLRNRDPRKNPSVRFNYLSKKKDLDECAEMVVLLQHVARSEPVMFFLGVLPQNNLLTRDDELRDFCKENVRTYYHVHGGCVVGSVVDKDFRVYGVRGLRVIDGSTFKESPGTNPMATLLMMGRYQGIKILGERKKKTEQPNP